jgi:hypothetical protein
LEEDDREFAEAHYKLSLAYEFSKSFVLALEQAQAVVGVLNRKMASLRKIVANTDGSVDAETKAKANIEIDEIEGLLPDMNSKVSIQLFYNLLRTCL